MFETGGGSLGSKGIRERVMVEGYFGESRYGISRLRPKTTFIRLHFSVPDQFRWQTNSILIFFFVESYRPKYVKTAKRGPKVGQLTHIIRLTRADIN